MTSRLRTALAREPWLAGLVSVTAILDSAYSILRYDHFGAGIDLAIFDQAIWHYSHFQAPLSSFKSEDLLGDHFHPLIALLAPLYWVWSDPRTLVIAQAMLVAASIVPVFMFAQTRLPRAAAYMLAVAYAAFWGIQVGVGYEFHELAFAPVLIATAILCLDRRRWTGFWMAIVALMLVKEDMAMVVAFLGFYALSVRQWRVGVALVALGIGWFELVTHVLVPAFGHSFNYWSYDQLGHDLPSAVWGVVKAPWRLFTIGLGNPSKRMTVVALLAPFLALSLGSRLFIVAIPLLAERFLSSNPAYWQTSYQYSLAIAPVLATAAAAGLANLTVRLRAPAHRRVLLVSATLLAGLNIALTSSLNSQSAVSKLSDSSFYGAPAYVAQVNQALAQVPPTASLAVTDLLAPHVSERRQIAVLFGRMTPQYIVYDVGSPFGQGAQPSQDVLGGLLNGLLVRMTPVFFEHDWLVARLAPAGSAPTNGVLTPLPAPASRTILTAWLTWGHALSDLYRRIISCARALATRGSCPDTSPTALATANIELRRQIVRALPQVHGGCNHLARIAAAAAAELTGLYEAVGTAGRSGDLVRLGRALASARSYVMTTDPLGRVQRLLVLCSPRA